MGISIQAVIDKVVDAQREAGYMESTIGQTMVAARSMIAYADFIGQSEYTKEFGARFAAQTTSPKTGCFSLRRKRLYGRLARLCNSYLDTGAVDLSKATTEKTEFVSSQAYREIAGEYGRHLVGRDLAGNTVNYYTRLAEEFLAYLESHGCLSLDEAPPGLVIEFIAYLRAGRWSGTSVRHLVSNFRPFLKYLERNDMVEALGLVDTRGCTRIVEYLDSDAQEAMSIACCSNEVTHRDAAIVLLALSTGLRACDIIGLRIADIDWISGTISLLQKKTGNPVNIPMIPAVGNAISSYLLDERPKCADNHVFVRSVAPHIALSDHASIYNIIRKVQRIAGVTGSPCGCRALRHNAATKMLASGTQLATISAVLGHADPSSTDVYISCDEEGMAACILPLLGKGLK